MRTKEQVIAIVMGRPEPRKPPKSLPTMTMKGGRIMYEGIDITTVADDVVLEEDMQADVNTKQEKP